jgi:hypothetical protein
MAKAKKKNLAESIRQRLAPFGGVELELPKRDPVRLPPAIDTTTATSRSAKGTRSRNNRSGSLPKQ